MSRDDDRCAFAGCPATRWSHERNPTFAANVAGQLHSFVEPTESSDEATVLDAVDIARKHWDAVVKAGGDQLDYVTLDNACVEAFAAGRATAFKRCAAIAGAANTLQQVRFGIADAISRAGGTTK